MERLIIFTRYPEPGQTKTRLIPVLGAEGAANLQREMTEYTLGNVQPLLTVDSLSLEIYFTGGNEELLRDWLGKEWVYRCQGEGDLGDRLSRAFQAAFWEGMRRVIIVGTDCPGLTASLLDRAFHYLQTFDLVLGPALDGGYYLIGLSRFIPQLFEGITWGSDRVFAQTLTIADTWDCSTTTLPSLGDIDTPADLEQWRVNR